MTQYLMMDCKETTVKCMGINGVTAVQIGGLFHRESVLTTQNNDTTNRAASIFSRAFAYHSNSTPRIYQFDPLAYYVPVGTYSTTQAAFHAFEAGDTWSTDGGSTTGTFVEDGVSTDGYILVRFTTGSPNINNTDTITITSGPANAETADATADAAQGGAAGEEGEWKVVLAFSGAGTTANDDQEFGGMFALNINNKHGLACWYHDTSNNVYGATYDPKLDLWSQALIGSVTVADRWGKSHVFNDTIYTNIQTNTASAFRTATFNPSTMSFGTQLGTGLVHTSSDVAEQINFGMAQWKSRIFSTVPSTTVDDGRLIELVAGTWGEVYNFNGGSTAGLPSYRQDTAKRGNFIFEHGEKLWVGIWGDLNIVPGFGFIMHTFTEKSGVITCDNAPGSGVAFTTGDVAEKLAQFLLPSTLAVGGANFSGANLKVTTIKDQISNDPDGQDIIINYFTGDKQGGNTDVMHWAAPFTDLPTVTLNWSGQADQGSDIWRIPVTAGTPSADLAVDDWTGENADEQIFRVTTVNDGSNYIEIHNPGGLALPTGTAQSRKLNTMSLQGIAGGIAHLSHAHGDNGGGGKDFTREMKSVIITNVQPITDEEQITLIANGFNSPTVSVSLYHGQANDRVVSAKSTINKPAGESWTLGSGNMTLITADGVTEHKVNHETVTDGLNVNDVIRRNQKAF